MQAVRDFLGYQVDSAFMLAWMSLGFIALETLAPRRGAKVSATSRLRAIAFSMVYSIAIVLVYDLMRPLWSGIGVKPLFPSLAPPGLPHIVGVLVGCVAAAYVGDFVYYWCHRIQHRWFWRFHAVHHSVRELSGIASYHHFSEEAFKLVLYTAPLALITTDPYAFPILGMLLGLQGNYLHSPTWMNFGPLGRYFMDNRLHRIHHSLEPQHFDKNFGLFTTLWDSLFGTLYAPAADEWPETGVHDFPEPLSVGAFLVSPFTYRKRAARPAAALAQAERA